MQPHSHPDIHGPAGLSKRAIILTLALSRKGERWPKAREGSPPARSPTAHFAVAVGRLYNRSQNLEPGPRLRAGGLHTYNVFKPATIKAQSGSLVIKRW